MLKEALKRVDGAIGDRELYLVRALVPKAAMARVAACAVDPTTLRPPN